MKSNRGIVVSGNGRIDAGGHIVVGDKTTIMQSPSSSAAEKAKELESLVHQFLAETNKLPEQFAEERSVITKLIGELREEMRKEKPSALKTQISAKGLVEAAATMQNIVPGLLGLARTIVSYFV